MDNTLVHRQYATPSVLNWICTSRCWHLDVWLYLSERGRGDRLYVLAETREGGRTVLGRQWFALVRDTVFGVYQLQPIDWQPVDLAEVHLNAPAVLGLMRGNGGDVFWRLLSPMANLWPRGSYKRRSVAFHMVSPVGVADPCEGLANHYGSTGRAVRDALHGAKVRSSQVQQSS